MRDLIDLEQYPIDRPESAAYADLAARCRAELERDGMYNLPGFLRPEALERAVREVAPVMAAASFTHQREHNIYFEPEIPGLAADHPALQRCTTVNHTVCADQIPESVVLQVYAYASLMRFLADTLGIERLYLMDDPLARANVMAYRAGEALNWHFDRSLFTVTLPLQQPEGGGAFEYRSGLRADGDPNYEGVAKLLRGEDPEVRSLTIAPGTLNLFRGKNTAHRVTPIEGPRERLIAVFSYYERPGVVFSEEERVGFYGRAA